MPLTEQQFEAALSLAVGIGSTRVAKDLGVAHSTVWRWTKDDEFAAEVERIRKAATTSAISRLRGAVDVAVNALVDVAMNTNEQGSARVAAAREILSRAGVVATMRIEVTNTLEQVADDDLDAELAEAEAELAREVSPLKLVG